MERRHQSPARVAGPHAPVDDPEYAFAICFNHSLVANLLTLLAIILRLGFFHWIWTATLPPILFVGIFKFWLTRQFDQKFRWYLPSDDSVRKTHVHSANADNQGHRLEKRFGHPALYADLFTPMVHAKMVHLLPQGV